jgi:hypothetical protein
MPVKKLPIYGDFSSLQATIQMPDTDTSSPAKAPYYLNGYFETYKTVNEDRKLAFCKRPGTQRVVEAGITGLTGFTNGHHIQGIISSLDKTGLVIYSNNGTANTTWFFDGTTLSNKGIAPAAAGNWSYTKPVIFTLLDGISYGSNRYYAATDRTKGAVIDGSGNWTEITDAQFTGLDKVTGFCAMNGYLFIGTSNNRIYNSDLNDAVSWQALSFLTAADTPGALMWLERLRNYIVAFKQNSLEFFEDTGNPTPGSPLTAQKQLNKNVGLVCKSSVRTVSDGIIFLGIAGNGKISVYKLKADDLSLEIISNQYIEQVIAQFPMSLVDYSVDPITGVTTKAESQVINYKDKEWYLICIRTDSVDRTYVYDNELLTWTRWATCTTGNDVLDDNFTPWQSVVYNKGSTIYNLMVQNKFSGASVPPCFVCFYSANSIFFDCGSASSSTAYSYPLIWVSDIHDFNSRNRKFMDSLEVLLDTVNRTQTSTYTLTLYYGDGDYNVTFPAGRLVTRTLTLSTHTSIRAIFRILGSFRKRWFAIKHSDSTSGFPFRIWGIEVNYNDGETEQEG